MGAAALCASARLIRIQRALGAITIRQLSYFNGFYYNPPETRLWFHGPQKSLKKTIEHFRKCVPVLRKTRYLPFDKLEAVLAALISFPFDFPLFCSSICLQAFLCSLTSGSIFPPRMAALISTVFRSPRKPFANSTSHVFLKSCIIL